MSYILDVPSSNTNGTYTAIGIFMNTNMRLSTLNIMHMHTYVHLNLTTLWQL